MEYLDFAEYLVLLKVALSTGGGLSYEECMWVCHVLGPYFQSISERAFQFFTKIRERVIIFGRNSIVYIDLVWTKNPKC